MRFCRAIGPLNKFAGGISDLVWHRFRSGTTVAETPKVCTFARPCANVKHCRFEWSIDGMKYGGSRHLRKAYLL